MSQQINLLVRAADASSGRVGRPLAPILWASAAMAAMAIAAGTYERTRLRDVEAQAAAVAKTLHEIRAQREQFASARRSAPAEPQRDPELERLAAQLKGRRDVLAAMASDALGTTEGFSAYMRAFSRQATGSVWLTSFALRAGGTELTLSGRTTDADGVTDYLQRLRSEPLLAGRKLASMQVVQPGSTAGAGPVTGAGGQRPANARYVEFTVASPASSGDASRLAGDLTTPALIPAAAPTGDRP